MDPAIRTALRTGQPLDTVSGPQGNTPGSRLTFGQ
jgi:hypothetical protein